MNVASTSLQACDRGFRQVLVLLVCWLLLIAAGSAGCSSRQVADQQDEQSEEEANEEEDEGEDGERKKKKPVLEVEQLQPLLGQSASEEAALAGTLDDDAAQLLLIKPGHWTPTVQRMKPNYTDFVGRNTLALLNEDGRATALEYSRFTLRYTRPVALAKGREKRVEGEVFVPEQSTATRIEQSLTNLDTGRVQHQQVLKLARMPSYQYFVVVLAKESSRYAFLKVTDTVRAMWEEESNSASQPHYRVVLADAQDDLPLASSALAWTSVAYVVWDEVDPSRLSASQQQALVDWMHWGGRLIVNGPDSLDTLRGSFLDQWLPAERTGSQAFDADALRGWSGYWGKRSRGENIPALQPTQPWSGVKLEPRAEGRELAGGGGLFFERDVGLGSVVVSAVQLSERDLVNWPGLDSFLNAGLLRRPQRRYSLGPYGGNRVDWANHRTRRLDASFVTGLRLASRDVGTKANIQHVENIVENMFGQAEVENQVTVDRPGGVGSWNAFSPLAQAAREALTTAAAVRVPKGGFVLACLAAYLAVLVPLNWMVFRSLGRVEWAWVAAPAIALLGTWVIVRQAQLDIGFVRSHTEVGMLELQSPYPRGLLSRYSALYSSLSTTYDAEFAEQAVVAAPFPATERNTRRIGDSLWEVEFERAGGTRLSGLTVSSASTQMFHSEQMFELAGPLQLGRSSRGHEQVENRSGYRLRDLMLVRRRLDNRGRSLYQGDWIGDLRDGESAVLSLRDLNLSAGGRLFDEERSDAAVGAVGSRLELGALVDLAMVFPAGSDPRYGQREETRLVGIIDQVLPGNEVEPAASQTRGATVVLAHLSYGAPPQPVPDVNSSADVMSEE